MRICPRCLYHDNPMWRPRIFDPGVDITRIEDFEHENPFSIAAWLRAHPTKTTEEDPFYVYRMTKSGMVWRKEKEIWKDEGWHVPSEKIDFGKSAKYKRD